MAIEFSTASEHPSPACGRPMFAKKTMTYKMFFFERAACRRRANHARHEKCRREAAFFMVRPAGRTCLEVKVLYPPGKGKDQPEARAIG